MMSAPEHIGIRGLAISRGRGARKQKILSDLTLEIRRGERIGLVGQNGSGKTTLLRLLLGLEAPDAGEMHRDGSSVDSIGYVPQDYRNALFPWLRLSDNLRLAVDATAHREGYMALAERFRLQLELSHYPGQLSGGEQQLFLLVRTLIAEPTLLVLDEPLSAVDYGRKRLVCEYLGREHPRNTTIIVATHDFDDAVMLSDRVIILSKQKIGIAGSVGIPFPWPRCEALRHEPEFRNVVDSVTEAVLCA